MTPSITVILGDLVRIHSQGTMLLLPIADLVAIRSCENYTRVHIADGRIFTIRMPLKCWEEQLPAAIFVRTHRTTLINLDRVRTHQRVGPKKWTIDLRDHPEAVPVGRIYWHKIKRLLTESFGRNSPISQSASLSA